MKVRCIVVSTIVTLACAVVSTAYASSATKFVAYVSGFDIGQVRPVDLSSATLESTISVPNPYGSTLAPDGQTVWVTSYVDGKVTPIDVASNTAGTPIAVDVHPITIAFKHDGSTAYVANAGSSTISVIDTATKTVTATIPVAQGAAPTGLAVTSDDSTLYVADFYGENLSVIDTATNVVTGTIAIGGSAYAVVLSPDDTTAYVSRFNLGKVSAVDLGTGTITETVSVPGGPRGLALTQDGSTLYAASEQTTVVSKIDTANFSAPPVSIDIGHLSPLFPRLTPDEATVYSSNYSDGTITAIDAVTDVVGSTIGPLFDAAPNQTEAHATGISIATVDAEAPTTTITPSGTHGSNGWYTSDVTVDISADDPVADDGVAGNGLAQTRCALDPNPAPSSFDDLPDADCDLTNVANDGAHTVYAASVDRAGNKETPVVVAIKIDQTAPELAPTVTPNPLLLGAVGTALPHATDATSGVATSSCDAVTTATLGDHTVACHATDNAGNSTNQRFHYVVSYGFLGFFSPAPGSKWKVGQTVPVKFALIDATGARISDAAAAALVSSPCKVKVSATGAQTLVPACAKYDPATDQFIYNWQLGKSGTGAAVIKATISYPGTTTTTIRSQSITITK